MKTVLKIENLALLGLSAFLFTQLAYSWWWYPVLFFAPDLSMLGYLGGTRAGGLIYNLVHHHAVSIGLYILGFILGTPILQLAGVVLFGHSCLDRALGYGLKFSDSFQNTHLGVIGQK
jgi:ABC-type nitrate/sulfonate/bicarbonate transport system permease component